MMDSYRLYGQAMLEFLGGGPGRFTFVRDDGYRDPSDVKPLFAPYSRWPGAERRAIRSARGHVLDVGCGAGRVALYLQRKGLLVSAIDISPEAVECARLRGVRDVRRMDARHLSFPDESFDTIVMFGNNLGVCGDLAATRRFLRRAHRITRKGGRLVAGHARNLEEGTRDVHQEERASRPSARAGPSASRVQGQTWCVVPSVVHGDRRPPPSLRGHGVDC